MTPVQCITTHALTCSADMLLCIALRQRLYIELTVNTPSMKPNIHLFFRTLYSKTQMVYLCALCCAKTHVRQDALDRCVQNKWQSNANHHKLYVIVPLSHFEPQSFCPKSHTCMLCSPRRREDICAWTKAISC